MSMIEVAPVSLFRSPTVLEGTHSVKVGVAPNVPSVQAGTPLVPSPEGWVPAKNGLGEFVAGTGASGGELIAAFRIATVDFHRQPEYLRPWFKLGERYTVKDVDDKGMPEFALDPSGVYIAVSRTAMLMDMTIAALHRRALEATRGSSDDQGSPERSGDA